MTTVAVIDHHAIERQQAALAGLLGAIRNAESVEQITEFRARLEAARAWAKVHNKVKEVRLELLVAEIAAMVRLVELGGIDLLPARDRKAAQYLADMSPSERADFIRTSRSATTAAGLCQSVWSAEEAARREGAARDSGREFATDAGETLIPADEVRRAARRQVTSLLGAVHAAASEFTTRSSFTVDEIAAEIIADAGIEDPMAEDVAFREGVREVVRHSLRNAPALSIGNLNAPSLITCLAPDGETWQRIPTGAAHIEHLEQMIAIREAQIEQSRLRLKSLTDFRDKLRALPYADLTQNIAAIIAGATIRMEEAA